MNLHGEIMNLPRSTDIAVNLRYAGWEPALAYKEGHRDARHGAAELALKADACIEALRDILDTGFAGGPQAKRAREALAALDGMVLVSG